MLRALLLLVGLSLVLGSLDIGSSQQSPLTASPDEGVMAFVKSDEGDAIRAALESLLGEDTSKGALSVDPFMSPFASASLLEVPTPAVVEAPTQLDTVPAIDLSFIEHGLPKREAFQYSPDTEPRFASFSENDPTVLSLSAPTVGGVASASTMASPGHAINVHIIMEAPPASATPGSAAATSASSTPAASGSTVVGAVASSSAAPGASVSLAGSTTPATATSAPAPTPAPTPGPAPCGLFECAPGFSCKDFTDTNYSCVDLDECLVDNGGCPAGQSCKNTIGSRVCADLNECLINNGGCGSGFICVDTKPGHRCDDVNECSDDNGGCPDGSKCENKNGGKDCVFPDVDCAVSWTEWSTCSATCGEGTAESIGSILVKSQGRGNPCPELSQVRACILVDCDVNECLTNNGGCGAGYTCENTATSFVCNDIDECKADNGGCGEHAQCTNIPGSRYCTDINECATNNGGCGTGYQCINIDGGRQCKDIDECDAVSNGGCQAGYACQNTPGSRLCLDVNECKVNNGGCAVGNSCVNKEGSFECVPNDVDCVVSYTQWSACSVSCGSGFQTQHGTISVPKSGRGTDCTELLKQQSCLLMECPQSVCGEDNGGCDSGYRCVPRDAGKTCEDINECLINNGGCGHHVCHNAPGSHTCEGGDGTETAPISLPPGSPTFAAAPSSSDVLNGDGPATVFAMSCLRNNGDCGEGFLCVTDPTTTTGVRCDDLDECSLENGGCLDGFMCRNTPGGRDCVDIDECAIDGGMCPPGFRCENTEGSRNCADIDECDWNFTPVVCADDEDCTNLSGTFKCDKKPPPPAPTPDEPATPDLGPCGGSCDAVCATAAAPAAAFTETSAQADAALRSQFRRRRLLNTIQEGRVWDGPSFSAGACCGLCVSAQCTPGVYDDAGACGLVQTPAQQEITDSLGALEQEIATKLHLLPADPAWGGKDTGSTIFPDSPSTAESGSGSAQEGQTSDFPNVIVHIIQ